MSADNTMLQVDALKKSYGNLVAVNGVSFQAGAGEIIGLLGPNGAGKTTTVSIIAGLLRPDSGSVRIEGRPLSGDTDPNKRRIGLVPQDVALFDELTAQANLELFAALYDLDGTAAKRAIGQALDLVGLADRAQERVRNYSGGMKRRLNLAAALLHDPQILLLDEPTVGVDPQSRNAIFDNLEVLKQRGKTLVYTTHYMEEAERLCDRVIIIDHGQVVANDTLQGLYRLLPVTNLLAVELERGQDGLRLDELQALPGVRSATIEAGTLRVGVEDLATETPRLLQWLVERGHLYRHVVSERADLETVFLTLTGRSLRDS
jgi:ABC-2 type transport system ATP-binding protein